MSGYNSKNYAEQGGEVLHIGGKIVFDEGAHMEGTFAMIANCPSSEATTIAALKDDFNALITALKASGLMVPDTEPDPESDEGTEEAT